jgi:hypothetical protein
MRSLNSESKPFPPKLSKLIRNVPVVNLLEMSLLLMLSRTSQWHSMSRVGGRGGKGRQWTAPQK